MKRLARGKEIYVNIKEFDEFIRKLKEQLYYISSTCKREVYSVIDKLVEEFRGKE